MNEQRMLAVADAIEKDALRERGITFNMGDWLATLAPHCISVLRVRSSYECGTVGCIAGFTCVMFAEVGEAVGEGTAMAYLGLTRSQAQRLFANEDEYIAPGVCVLAEITPRQAVAAIRRMVREEGRQDHIPDSGKMVDPSVIEELELVQV